MKYLVLVLFLSFSMQRDSVRVDTVVIKNQAIQQELNNIDSELDSIIALLKSDTLKVKRK